MTLDEAAEAIKAHPAPGLLLWDFRAGKPSYTHPEWVRFVASNKHLAPREKMALVWAEGGQISTLLTESAVPGRGIRAFSDIDEAMAWLEG